MENLHCFSTINPNPNPNPKPNSSSSKKTRINLENHIPKSPKRRRRRREGGENPKSFSDLPSDVLSRIAAAFPVPDLWAASAACRSWRETLRPLREAAVLLRWGLRFRDGRAGVSRDPDKALGSFARGAERGSAAAMVEVGLLHWAAGRRAEAAQMYRRSAEAGHPAGMCNLGTVLLEADPPEPEEAVKWFYQAAESGYARAQYNLALCLHKGRGVKCSPPDAAKWYVKAAECGYSRAMYNASLCYSMGEGLKQDLQRARMWMKRAADDGHKIAQFEHGRELFKSGELMKALIYLELATRAGETGASQIRDVILQALSQTSRDRAMRYADKWQPRRFKE